jgi:hypothetical protein
MAITKEVLDELLKDCHGADDFYGPDGPVKRLSKALIERMMQAELTEHLVSCLYCNSGYVTIKYLHRNQREGIYAGKKIYCYLN